MYTKGPWKIDRQGITILSIGPCIPNEYAGTAWLEVSDENANLIAAAPELLEALEAAIEWIDAVPSDTLLPTMPGVSRDWIDSIIAKAKGKS